MPAFYGKAVARLWQACGKPAPRLCLRYGRTKAVPRLCQMAVPRPHLVAELAVDVFGDPNDVRIHLGQYRNERHDLSEELRRLAAGEKIMDPSGERVLAAAANELMSNKC